MMLDVAIGGLVGALIGWLTNKLAVKMTLRLLEREDVVGRAVRRGAEEVARGLDPKALLKGAVKEFLDRVERPKWMPEWLWGQVKNWLSGWLKDLVARAEVRFDAEDLAKLVGEAAMRARLSSGLSTAARELRGALLAIELWGALIGGVIGAVVAAVV